MSLKKGTNRGIITEIKIQILYPDGRVVCNTLNPIKDEFGMMIFSDSLLNQYLFPLLNETTLSQLKSEWEGDAKSWETKPTFVLVPSGSEKGSGWPPKCDCCIAKHIATSDQKNLKINIEQPSELSKKIVEIENVKGRGFIRRLLIEVEYPDGKREISTIDPIKDGTGLIVFSEDLIEKSILPVLPEDQRKDLIDAWNGEPDDWRTRPSYIKIPVPTFICPHWDCCAYVHRMNEMLTGH